MIQTSMILIVVVYTLVAYTGMHCHAYSDSDRDRDSGSDSAGAIVLDGDVVSRRFDGHGGLSAGASSRLLFDYPEPQRSDILDYLFGDKGAKLHICKVEIGGDVQSTDGAEASHMHTRYDLNFGRGYEWWLMAEAKKRNPDVLTYALSWGVPGWVGNGSYFSKDNIYYQVAFVRGAQKVYNITIDYLGIWNERSWGSPDYVKELRSALDSFGFTSTVIVGADGDIPENQIQALAKDPVFSRAEPILGRHYPCANTEPPSFWNLVPHKTFWANEDYSTVADWNGGGCWGRSLNQNYVKLNATSTIAWSTIWSVYDSWRYYGNGLMYAYWPHSGYYEVKSPIWTSAHTTQFANPGWRYLGGSGCGLLPGGGSWVALVPNEGLSGPMSYGQFNTVKEAKEGDFTLVIEKLNGACLRCRVAPTTTETLSFKLAGPLLGASPVLHVWLTNSTHQFIQLPDIRSSAQGEFSITVQADSIVTITTTVGQGKKTSTIPPMSHFPLPYSDNYSSRPAPQPAKYHADNGGSFEIAADATLLQAQPLYPAGTEWVADYDPITSLGSTAWADVSITVSTLPLAPSTTEALLDPLVIHPEPHTGLFNYRSYNITGGDGGVGGGPIAAGAYSGVCVRQFDLFDSGYCLLVGAGLVGAGVGTGKGWVLQAGTGREQRAPGTILASGALPVTFELGAWHSVKLQAKGDSLTAWVDDTQVTSVTSTTYSAGLVSLRSGYHYAKFDTLYIDGNNPPTQNTLLTGVVPRNCGRNDFTGLVGVAVTASTNLAMTHLGRYFGTSGSSVHVLSVVDALTAATLGQATVTSSTPRDVYGFAYAAVDGGKVVHVKQGQRVYIVSNETVGVDSFCDLESYGRAAVDVCDNVAPVFNMAGKWTEYDQLVDNLYGPLNALLSA